MWGKPCRYQTMPGHSRITPTYVGTTNSWALHGANFEDHPHIRGDHMVIAYLCLTELESPPHTWGPHVYPPEQFKSRRITPTYVGTTFYTSTAIWFSQDHPHIRGDHHAWLSPLAVREGSPPHTWGPPLYVGENDVIERITPTYVGTTSSLRQRPSRALESPPHTWGPQDVNYLVWLHVRITPTYVGTTRLMSLGVNAR